MAAVLILQTLAQNATILKMHRCLGSYFKERMIYAYAFFIQLSSQITVKNAAWFTSGNQSNETTRVNLTSKSFFLALNIHSYSYL